MATLFISFSIAAALTAIFNFRFSAWHRPLVLVPYFLFFFTLEWIGEYFFLPPGALGITTGVVCLGITALFLGASYGIYRLELADSQRSRRGK